MTPEEKKKELMWESFEGSIFHVKVGRARFDIVSDTLLVDLEVLETGDKMQASVDCFSERL
jgi:hypothetical protein